MSRDTLDIAFIFSGSFGFAGVKNADESELREIASEPTELTVHMVPDFPLLSSLVGDVSRALCMRLKERRREADLGKTSGMWTGP